jgi:hypothetical protein
MLWRISAMQKKSEKSLLYLDPEVVFHTNDVTLNSSIEQIAYWLFVYDVTLVNQAKKRDDSTS